MASKYTREFKKGEVIYKEGDSADCAYLLNSGKVMLYTGESADNVVTSINEGELFGEMSLIEGSSRITSAVAVENGQCSLVFREQLNERINESDPLIRLLIVTYINRLRNNFKQETTNNGATKIINIKSFSMGILSKEMIKTEEDVIEKLHLENYIKDALDSKQYYMQFQPIINLKTQELSGMEALIRSDVLKKKNINPEKFMEIAEETSLIVPLGHWVIQTALKEFGRFKQIVAKSMGKVPKLFISVNVSARQIADSKFFEVLQKSTWANKLKAQEVKIEITERVLVDEDVAFKWINKLSKMGYSVAIDDFGTGFTNFSYISRINVANIKIDKKFVRGIHQNKNINSIVHCLVDMAQKLGIEVIAEGVEGREEFRVLRNMDCNYGQGYLFARPMSIEKLVEHITKSSKKRVAA